MSTDGLKYHRLHGSCTFEIPQKPANDPQMLAELEAKKKLRRQKQLSLFQASYSNSVMSALGASDERFSGFTMPAGGFAELLDMARQELGQAGLSQALAKFMTTAPTSAVTNTSSTNLLNEAFLPHLQAFFASIAANNAQVTASSAFTPASTVPSSPLIRSLPNQSGYATPVTRDMGAAICNTSTPKFDEAAIKEGSALCGQCGKSYKSEAGLQQHRESAHHLRGSGGNYRRPSMV